MSQPIKVGIIGTAGRQGSDQQLSRTLFEKMVDQARYTILHTWQLKPRNVKLVSGGAAWADHVAVRLFASGEFPHLTLHFPTRWDAQAQRFSYETKTGQSANHYHSLFSEALQGDSWQELQDAIQKGARVLDHYDGFFDRNDHVARESDFLLAFTLEHGLEPSRRSGTYYTWSRCHLPPWKKTHISLTQL